MTHEPGDSVLSLNSDPVEIWPGVSRSHDRGFGDLGQYAPGALPSAARGG
jgi:hypothetical protein